MVIILCIIRNQNILLFFLNYAQNRLFSSFFYMSVNSLARYLLICYCPRDNRSDKRSLNIKHQQ